MTTLEPPADGLSYRSRTGWWVIAASVLGSGMASIDATVVGIALPTIGRDFHATVAQLQWVVNGYTLAVAALELTPSFSESRFAMSPAISSSTAKTSFASRVNESVHT